MGNTSRSSRATSRLAVVPMFHANAWGLPMPPHGRRRVVMPDRFLQAEPLVRLIAAESRRYAGAVPTIWTGILA